MWKNFLFAILAFSIGTSFAQDSLKIRKAKELHLAVVSFTNPAVSFYLQKQLSDKMYFRIGLINVTTKAYDQNSKDSLNGGSKGYTIAAGVMAGLEFRRTLTENWTFIHGPSYRFYSSYDYTYLNNKGLTEYQKVTIKKSFLHGLNYSFGVMYALNAHLLLSSRIEPGISATEQITRIHRNPAASTSYWNFSSVLNSGNGNFEIIYRW